jgi:hypothetical protein
MFQALTLTDADQQTHNNTPITAVLPSSSSSAQQLSLREAAVAAAAAAAAKPPHGPGNVDAFIIN